MTRRKLLGLLVLLPLLVGVALAAYVDPARTWSSGEEVSGAPSAQSPTGIDPAELVDARRAAGEASSQAGFAVSGADALADGTTEIREGVDPLVAGVDELSSGANELSNGMVELQAGVGQLGTGATEVADAVGGTVDQVMALDAVRGQITAAIDRTVEGLEGNEDPAVVSAREELLGLRGEVETIQLPEQLSTDLTRLKDGSREIANQLSVPGFAFHDGIYSATEGAAALNQGLTELDGGVGAAVDGVTELDDGAQQLTTVTDQTKEKIEDVGRAMPVTAPVQAEDDQAPTLSPTVAMLIAALVLLAGAAAGVAAYLARRRRWWVLGGGTVAATITGVILTLLLATGLSPAATWISALVFGVGALASAGLTLVAFRILGARWGAIVSVVLAIMQVGLVGWVWRSVSSGDVSVWVQALAGITPLHWATTSLTALGNAGAPGALWAGVGVLAVVAVLGLVYLAVIKPGGVRNRPEQGALGSAQ